MFSSKERAAFGVAARGRTLLPTVPEQECRDRDGVPHPEEVWAAGTSPGYDYADPTADAVLGRERVWFRRDAVGYALALFAWSGQVKDAVATQAAKREREAESVAWLAAYRAKLGR